MDVIGGRLWASVLMSDGAYGRAGSCDCCAELLAIDLIGTIG